MAPVLRGQENPQGLGVAEGPGGEVFVGKCYISGLGKEIPPPLLPLLADRAIKKTIPDLGWDEEEAERRHWSEVAADWNINIDNDVVVVDDEVEEEDFAAQK
ncbi:4353_t:CDS:2 [Paraglomus brasilianum]|uniref:4353_t:CDS:1 n=1 Tax=Paraglomus brasilianum TaxID=144538 RepID=A0A9N9FPC9_9GLOM|nr:4353_t:CDS:2 [Paraglomus brasilianum]